MDSDDDSWVFDSLVCYLNGPIWNAPLQTFIEERSLIFEPNMLENEEYRVIFDDFRNMVDFMLSSFMEDIGISPQQFEEACLKGAREGAPLHFDQNIFEQIWAANDYEMFKRMMTQRNVELQLQALELIEQKYGMTPQSFIPRKKGESENSAISESNEEQVNDKDIEDKPLEEDVSINDDLVRCESANSVDLEKVVLREAKKHFPSFDLEVADGTEAYLKEEKVNLEESLKKAIEEKLLTQKLILDQELAANAENKESSSLPVGVVRPQTEKIVMDKSQNMVDSLELKKRQEYLRTQRDKLVALKREERKKQLPAPVEHEDENVETLHTETLSGKGKVRFAARPKSARAARKLLENPRSSGIRPNGASTAAEPQHIKLRRALVERLKSEVVGKKD